MADVKPKRQQTIPPWLKPWVAVAAVLAILIVGYSGFLGTRYLSASSHVDSLEAQSAPAPGGGQSEISPQMLQQQQELLKERLESADYSLMDLIALISDTAEKTDVSVGSRVFDAPGEQTIGQFLYGTQRVRFSLAGGEENILGFLSFLADEVPLVIQSLSLAGLNDAPVADATLVFYMSVATTSPAE